MIESFQAVYFEDDNDMNGTTPREIVLQEECVIIPMHVAPTPLVAVKPIEELIVTQDELVDQIPHKIPNIIANDVVLRRSWREKRPAMSSDYVVYLQEHEFDIRNSSDPVTYKEAINSLHCSHSLVLCAMS